MNYKKTFLGSILVFLLATSCCWLPFLIVAIGGGSAMMGIANGLENYSWLFIVIGLTLLGFGIYQYRKRKMKEAILESTITCPDCGHKKQEVMPTNACQYFYDCENCKKVLKPINNDCCVYCSYGTVPCPPIQLDKSCC